jgi:hypothetical protein
VAAVLPALKQEGKIPIKLAALLTRLALRKHASGQPALHRAGTYSDLSANGGVTETLLP